LIAFYTPQWGGGNRSLTSFRRSGLFTAGGTNDSGTSTRTSTLSGLVPDGVATVTFEYPKIVSRGRDYKPTVYTRGLIRTVRVHDNVIVLRVPRDVANAFAARMVWRAANGTVIRIIKPSG
jgi:hypothetical protein